MRSADRALELEPALKLQTAMDLLGRLTLIGPVPHFLAGPTQHRADAMFRHADGRADFLVALSFQVVHSHDAGFLRI